VKFFNDLRIKTMALLGLALAADVEQSKRAKPMGPRRNPKGYAKKQKNRRRMEKQSRRINRRTK
jgi:hypothetical protein